jgi:putative sterol carrier protein
MPETGLPPTLQRLVDRYDPGVFELARSRARIRLEGAGPTAVDVVLDGHRAELEIADGERPDALLSADEETWSEIVDDVRGGMDARFARAG